MKISLIAALSTNRVIGQHNQMPWHLPADLKHFKTLTLGKPVVMGRKTFESIGKPLPQRHNIIVSRDTNFSLEHPNCTVVHTPEEALIAAGNVEEVMIIGGAQLFHLFLPQADRLYLTLIHTVLEGDTFFPAIQEAEWITTHQVDHPQDGDHAYSFSFLTLIRKRVG